MATKKKRLSEWNFSPQTLSALPTDAPSNGTARRNVYGAVFSACRPTPLKEERRLIAVRCGGIVESSFNFNVSFLQKDISAVSKLSNHIEKLLPLCVSFTPYAKSAYVLI